MSGEIRFDEPAARYTSMGVGGRIDALAFPQDASEAKSIADYLREQRIPFLPVGNWTNLIVTEGGYRGVLISLTNLRTIERREGAGGEVAVEAGAGVSLAEMVTLALREELTGMEFCAGIPGSVGGAVRMNAGAYGGAMKDVILAVRLLDATGMHLIPRDSLFFAYRSLDLPAETIIIGATFRLIPGARAKSAERVQEILALRRGKHPLEFRNAGSIFKNPPSVPAGRIIEEAGLKGMRIGDAEVSPMHGNFIVNRGKASAAEIIALIDLVRKRVYETTGYLLETEVRIIGE
jgi:UDP-N-acetylmuramate dehydrogenase